MNTIESWRPVVGWEGRYDVSDQGRVRSLMTHSRERFLRRAEPLILRPWGVREIPYVSLGANNLQRVHQLVLEAFVGPCPPGYSGGQVNGRRDDNRLENLRWMTAAEKRAYRFPLRGPDHPHWKGDDATTMTKRKRARRLYALRACDECGASATDRHHKDGDTGNNARTNIAILCRRCHMTIDGRLTAFVAAGQPGRRKEVPPPPCVNCGSTRGPKRHGRCPRCAQYLRRRGVEYAQAVSV